MQSSTQISKRYLTFIFLAGTVPVLKIGTGDENILIIAIEPFGINTSYSFVFF